jgi:hypothetical protein
MKQGVFTQPGSQAEATALIFDVGFTLNIRHSFDSSARQFRAADSTDQRNTF